MTAIKSISGQTLLVQLGDGGSPEAFAHDCLINMERGIKFDADRNEFVVPDCDNPDAPGWKQGLVDGLSVTISGAGMTHTPSIEAFFDWFNSGETKNIRFRVDVSGANGGGFWLGAFHLTSFEVKGSRNNKSDFACTMVSSGGVTWTNVA